MVRSKRPDPARCRFGPTGASAGWTKSQNDERTFCRGFCALAVSKTARSAKRCIALRLRHGVISSFQNGVISSFQKHVIWSFQNDAIAPFQNHVISSFQNHVISSFQNRVISSFQNRVISSFQNDVISSSQNDAISSFQNYVIKSVRTRPGRFNLARCRFGPTGASAGASVVLRRGGYG